ncbi:MAG: cytochrome c maturation protein CcmE [Pseudomonadota bacterium]
MTRKQRRFILIATCLGILSFALGLILYAVNDSIAFFYSPTKVSELNIEPGTRFRLGGLVQEGSVKRGDNAHVQFVVTDTNQTITVNYKGILPDLFREGQGVVTEGRLSHEGIFVAVSVLSKHDENYVPREVVDALKEQGVWKGGGQKPGSDKGNANDY